jgi:hypothetical protein
VIEADVRWPTDSGLAADGVKALAREGRKLAAGVGEKRTAVRDRSRSVGRKLRALTRTIRRRSGEAKREVLELTEQTGQMLETSIKEARTLAATARRRARGRGAQAKLKAAKTLEELADRCEKVCSQIRQRVAGEPIKDRLVSLWDPDARPIRKGKLGKPTEFGYVDQLCEITPNTKRGARGFILPPQTKLGNPAANTLLPDTASEIKNLNITLKEIVLDGGFMPTRATPRSRTSPTRSTSPAANRPAPSAPAAADSATEPAPKAGSATSNAATAWTDHASKATPATRSGPAGRHSATTPRPTPPSDDTREPRNPPERNPGPQAGKRKPRTEPRPRSPPARSTPTHRPTGLIRGK